MAYKPKYPTLWKLEKFIRGMWCRVVGHAWGRPTVSYIAKMRYSSRCCARCRKHDSTCVRVNHG